MKNKNATSSFLEFLKSLNEEEILQNRSFVISRIRNYVQNSTFADDRSMNIYVMHFGTGNFLFVSDHMANQGFDLDKIYEMGQGYMSQFHYPEELKVLREKIEPELFSRINSTPAEDIMNLYFAFDFRLITAEGEVKKFIQSFQLITDPNDKPFLVLSKVKEVTDYYMNNKMTLSVTLETPLGPKKDTIEYFPDFNYHLSSREMEILRCFKEGLSRKEIAQKLHISVNTLQNHRKNMLTKTQFNNIGQLINKANENGVI